MANYLIDNSTWNEQIRKLQNNDKASAEEVFNPLFSKTLNNVFYLKRIQDDLIEFKEIAEEKLRKGAHKIGDVVVTTRTDLEDKWLLCNGEPINQDEYPDLYNLLDERVKVITKGLLPFTKNGFFHHYHHMFAQVCVGDDDKRYLLVHQTQSYNSSNTKYYQVYKKCLEDNTPMQVLFDASTTSSGSSYTRAIGENSRIKKFKNIIAVENYTSSSKNTFKIKTINISDFTFHNYIINTSSLNSILNSNGASSGERMYYGRINTNGSKWFIASTKETAKGVALASKYGAISGTYINDVYRPFALFNGQDVRSYNDVPFVFEKIEVQGVEYFIIMTRVRTNSSSNRYINVMLLDINNLDTIYNRTLNIEDEFKLTVDKNTRILTSKDIICLTKDTIINVLKFNNLSSDPEIIHIDTEVDNLPVNIGDIIKVVDINNCVSIGGKVCDEYKNVIVSSKPLYFKSELNRQKMLVFEDRIIFPFIAKSHLYDAYVERNHNSQDFKQVESYEEGDILMFFEIGSNGDLVKCEDIPFFYGEDISVIDGFVCTFDISANNNPKLTVFEIQKGKFLPIKNTDYTKYYIKAKE